MDYVKLFADMLDDHFAELTDEEVGVIVRAALRYAATGEEPAFERRTVLGLTWRRFKSHVDQSRVKAETLQANAKKGGRKPGGTKLNQTEPEETKRNQTQAAESEPDLGEPDETSSAYTHTQEQEHDQEQEQEQEQEQARPGGAPAPAALFEAIGISGRNLPGERCKSNLVENLILRYRLNRDDDTREALIEDLDRFGEDRMREVLTEASRSNTRDRVSVNFWRAILSGRGRNRPGYGDDGLEWVEPA